MMRRTARFGGQRTARILADDTRITREPSGAIAPASKPITVRYPPSETGQPREPTLLSTISMSWRLKKQATRRRSRCLLQLEPIRGGDGLRLQLRPRLSPHKLRTEP